MNGIFPFLRLSKALESKWNTFPVSQVDWAKYELICCKCGSSRFEPEVSDEQWAISFGVSSVCKELRDVGFLCVPCAIPFLKYKETFRDLNDLSTCVNYIERAISCRKQYLKTQVKSKQLDSLDKCLSMRQREF